MYSDAYTDQSHIVAFTSKHGFANGQRFPFMGYRAARPFGRNFVMDSTTPS